MKRGNKYENMIKTDLKALDLLEKRFQDVAAKSVRWGYFDSKYEHGVYLRETPATSPQVRVERVTRIELALSAWEADVLPLNYTRVAVERLHRHRRGTQRHQRKVCRSSPPGASGGSAITPAERADRRATPGHVPTRGHAGLQPAEAFPPLLRRCPDRGRRRGRRVPSQGARRSDRWSRGLQ